MNIWEAAAMLLWISSTALFAGWKIYYYRKRAWLREEVRKAN